jgi:ferredoxin
VKAFVQSYICDGHGACVRTAPDVFKLGSDGKAYVTFSEIPEELHDRIRQAASACPTGAVLVID